MSKRTLRIMCLTLALVFFITPMAVLAGHEPTTVHGTVFSDVNGDGVFDPEELGLAGVLVLLLEGDGFTRVTDTRTSTDGTYEFANLDPSNYIVEVEVLVGYADTTPISFAFTVDGTALIPEFNFGKQPLPEGSISGTVYNDINRSRLFDDGDEILSNVSVRLIENTGAEIPTTTNALGEYEFTDLIPGSYTVVETDPDGFYSTTPNTVVVNLPTDDSMDVIVNFGDFIPEEGETKKIDLLLTKFFDLPLLDILELRYEDGWGYGNIAKAYFLAQLSGEPVGSIIAMREGMGWGNIMKSVLGRAGLKGYNLGLIVSGREVPNSTQKLIDGCEIITTPEEVQELFSSGASNGSIKKACKLAQEVNGNFETLVDALGLLKVHNQKQVREMLRTETTSQGTNSNRNSNNGNHGPPPCKGKNKHDEGCS